MNSNPSSANGSVITFQKTFSQKITTGTVVTRQNTHTFGVAISAKVGAELSVPGLAKASLDLTTTYSYQFQRMDSTATTNLKDDTLTVTALVSLWGGQAAHCKATILNGIFDSKYTSTILVRLADGATHKIQGKGGVVSSSWFQSAVVCGRVDPASIPESVQIIDVTKEKSEPVRLQPQPKRFVA